MSAKNRAMRMPGGSAGTLAAAGGGAAGYVLRPGDCGGPGTNTLKDYRRNPELLALAPSRILRKVIGMAFARLTELERELEHLP